MTYKNSLENGSLFTGSSETWDLNCNRMVCIPAWVKATLMRRGYDMASGLTPEVMQKIFSINDLALFIATARVINELFTKFIEDNINNRGAARNFEYLFFKNEAMVCSDTQPGGKDSVLMDTLVKLANTPEVKAQAIERLAGKSIEYTQATDQPSVVKDFNRQDQEIANQDAELYSIFEIDRNTVGVVVSATTALALFGNIINLVNKADNTYVTPADHLFFIAKAILEKLYDRNSYGTLASSSLYAVYLELLQPNTGKFQV